MKAASVRIIILLVLLGLGPLRSQGWFGQTSVSSVSVTDKVISGMGCVEKGVEAGCLVLHDQKTKRLYNLYFSKDKPLPGVAIRFTGTKHDGPTICMQGEAINVDEWTRVKLSCDGQR